MAKLNRRVYTEQWRYSLVIYFILIAFALLAVRAYYLQVVGKEYLLAQGQARYVREVIVKANRGRILDRNGQPLAVSAPVDSVWINPAEFVKAQNRWPELAKDLGIKLDKDIKDRVSRYKNKKFMYLKRHLAPELAKQIMALNISGVHLQREYKRFYPSGPIAGHVIGFTNVDGHGQEGIELAYNKHLRGRDGRKRVLRDRVGNIIENVEKIKSAVDGKDLHLSIDSRLQQLASRYLSAAVNEHKAVSGSVVVVDVETGELLAMVNEPSFNPNNRQDFSSSKFRNRAATDLLDPGSTVKPFTVAMALSSGRFSADTLIDTSPGFLKVGSDVIRDTHNYGLIDVASVVVKSSNVGATKLAFNFPVQRLLSLYKEIGYGSSTQLGLPGEIRGLLPQRKKWRPIEHATLSYGYGLSVTPVQIARAYTVLAGDGKLIPLNILKRETIPTGHRVLEPEVALAVRNIMKSVVSPIGTANFAVMDKYTAAGKTGTAHKLINGHYAEKRYTSVFAGFAPATDPKLVMVVVIDDPRGKYYFGGRVAGPVFSNVMGESLRLMNVPPDKIDLSTNKLASKWMKGGKP